MYRNGGRNKNLAVNVKSRIGSVWLDSRKYVDDGRGEERINSSPCKLKLDSKLRLRGRRRKTQGIDKCTSCACQRYLGRSTLDKVVVIIIVN